MTAVELPLLQRQAYVDGTWVDADSGETFPVLNPATGESVADVPRMGAAETRRALAAAERALPAWKARTAKDRARVLRRLADLMLEHEDDLARLMVTEQGKPLAEARVEVQYAASFYEWFGEEAKRVYGDTIPSPWPDKRIHVTKEPVGVTAGITPWNFPAAMPTRKSAPALAAGCTMVLKPAEQTPLCALAIAALAEEAGVPPGVFSVVTGAAEDAPAIGGEMTSNPAVRKLGLHGLDRGREAAHGAVRARAQEDLARARRQRAVHRLRRRRPRRGGRGRDHVQVPQLRARRASRRTGCSCRRGSTTTSSPRFTEAVRGLKVADGFARGRRTSGRSSTSRRSRRSSATSRTRSSAAPSSSSAASGSRVSSSSRPCSSGVPADAAMSCEETFGPVAGIARFSTEDEAVRIANDTPYGLAAYFYSQGLGRVNRVAEALEYGIVGINTGLISTEVAPFGGVKESGIGREGSSYGIDEWLELKYWAIGGIRVIVEQRDYHVYTGKLPELVRLYETEGIPIQQEILGGLVGAFTTDIGALSTYSTHVALRARSPTARSGARGSQADPRWKEFLAKVQPLIHTQQNRILVPTSFSPLR